MQEMFARFLHDGMFKSFTAYTLGLLVAAVSYRRGGGGATSAFLLSTSLAIGRALAQGPSASATAGGLRRLRGGLVVVTGGSAGIGRELVSFLRRHDVRCVATSRRLPGDGDDGSGDSGDPGLTWVKLDLCDLSSCAVAAARLLEIRETLGMPFSAIVLNAGVYPVTPRRTQQGFEEAVGANHLGHFALARALLPAVQEDGARVVAVSSLSHFEVPSGAFRWREVFATPPEDFAVGRSYAFSKLANVQLARELSRRGVDAVSLTPGLVRTNIIAGLPPLGHALIRAIQCVFGRDPEHGIATPVAALMREAPLSGEFMMETRVIAASTHALNDELTRELWEVSEELCDANWQQ